MNTLPPRTTYHLDEFAVILAAYADGHVVNWKTEGYRLAGGPDPDDIVVQYPANGHCCGLFHTDGVTSSYDPADFQLAPQPAPPRARPQPPEPLKPLPEGIADQVNKFRTARGLSFRNLEALSGVSRSVIWKLESHAGTFNILTIEKLAKAMGCKVSDLVLMAEGNEHAASTSNKISERKTVHEWLNAQGTPREENGKPLCLLRRLSIALNIHQPETPTP